MANGKRPVSEEVRREVARRYGCEPGMSITVHCEYCTKIGGLQWFLGFSGRGKGRVASTLEFDHSTAESAGGLSVASNIVLACLKCNRSKGSKPVSEWHQ